MFYVTFISSDVIKVFITFSKKNECNFVNFENFAHNKIIKIHLSEFSLQRLNLSAKAEM